MSFRRRPFLLGNTDSPVLNQPFITGNVAKDSSGEFPLTSFPSELQIETEAGATSVLLPSASAQDIVDQINTGMAGAATAEEVEGCIRVTTAGSGGTAFVRILQPLSFPDAAELLGFPVHPNPTATVLAGDQGSSPVRPRQQQNPAGTAFVAFGEDRVGQSYNRALQAVAGNTDYLHTQLRRSVAVPFVVEVEDSPAWAPYLVYDVNGRLDQINISDLALLNPDWTGRVFVGKLLNSSTLDEIAKYFAVQTSGDEEILVFNELTSTVRTLRVSAVTRGLRGVSKPIFADEVTAPSFQLVDTTGTAPDGGNALGVVRLKSGPVVITAVKQRTILSCALATFVTDGVTPGDTVDVAGALVDSPFNHTGSYLVETVVSETDLVVRPLDAADRGELNPDDSLALGTAEVSSSGLFEANIYLTLDPPLPRFPADGKLRLVVGLERELGDVPVEALLTGAIRTSEEVDSFLMRLFGRHSLNGVYDGQQEDAGAGFFAKVDKHPVTLVKALPKGVSAGTLDRSGTGEVLASNVLKADPSDSFTLSDLGQVVKLDGGAFLAQELFVITEFIDGEHVRLTPALEGMAVDLPVTSPVDYSVFEDAFTDFPAGLLLSAPDVFGPLDTANATPGYGYVREQRDSSTTDSTLPGEFGFVHLERVRLGTGPANILVTSATVPGTDNTILLSFAPEDHSNLFAEIEKDLYGTTEGPRGGTLVRILHGPLAGFYRILEIHSSPDKIEVAGLDGTIPTFPTLADPISIAFYNVVMGTQVPVRGKSGEPLSNPQVAGLRLFRDGYESGDDTTVTVSLGFRGAGAGIWAFLNDSGFRSYDNGDGADGFAYRATVYPPGHGFLVEGKADTGGSDPTKRAVKGYVARVHSNASDLSAFPAGVYYLYEGYAGLFSQTGKDPSLIVAKHTDANPIDPDFTNASFTAALVAVASDQPIGMGGAQDLFGSLYQHQAEGAFDDGGIYTETAVGAGRKLFPLHGQTDPADQPYYGVGFYTGIQTPTTLGQAGQLIPTSDASAAVAASFLPPDYDLFNFQHTEVFSFAAALIDVPLHQWVGTRVFIESGAGAPYDGLDYPVLAVRQVAATVYMAVKNLAPGSPIGAPTPVSVRVRGQRWYRSHADAADWVQLGTQHEPGTEHLLPVLTVDQATPRDIVRPPERAADEMVVTTGTPVTGVSHFDVKDGFGLGTNIDLASMGAVEVSLAAFTAASFWDDTASHEFWTTPWDTAADEPRAPFPNVGTITNDDAELDTALSGGGGGIGSLSSADYALEKLSAQDFTLTWTSDFGGSFLIDCTGLALTAQSARVWQRGGRLFTEAIYALRASAIVRPSTTAVLNTVDIKFQLIDDDGVVIAESSDISVSDVAADPTPQEHSYDFVLDDLKNSAFDKVDLSMIYDRGVHLALVVTIQQTPTLHLLRMKLESIGRPARVVGDLTAHAVTAHNFRYVSPVRDFQTVTPLEVELLNSHEYARLEGDGVGSAYPYGIQEEKGLGLISNAALTEFFRPHFAVHDLFKKGPHSAAIRLSHPYFDPLWYYFAADVPSTPGNTDHFVKPGRMGFLVPLNPPHGSILTSLHYGLSFLSCYDPTAGPLHAHFGVYHTDVTSAPYENATAWDANEGCLVRLWRYNCLDFGVDMDVDYSGTTGAEFGHSELLWSRTVDLSGVTEPVFASNQSVTVPGHYFSTEHFVRGGVDLIADAANAQLLSPGALLVDRRHFGYYLTIEFWGGPREYNTGGNTYEYTTAFENQYAETAITTAGGFQPQAVISPFPMDDVTAVWPPVVKFRGARLGWVTDRP